MALPRIANAPLYWICLVVMAAALIDLRWLHWFDFADHRLSDALVRIRAEQLAPDPDVVVIDIDDYSLTGMSAAVGRFPWPRSVYGEILDALEKQGAKAVVFDVEFYERDTVRPEQDDVFNEAIAPTKNTFFSMQWLDKISAEDGTRMADVATALELPSSRTANAEARLPLLLPRAITQKAWSRTGSINFNEDSDGVGRRYNLWRDYEGWLIPSLPARVGKSLGYTVPDEPSMLLSWLKGGAYPHMRVAFYDLYADINKSPQNRKRPPLEFKDKIVAVGSTAAGLHDFRNTPVSALTPGVEILATAMDNLKRGLILREAPWYLPYALVAISFLMLLFALARRWNLVQIFALLALGTVVLIGAAYFALSRSLLLPVGVPLFFAWVFFFLAALLAYLRELRERARTEAALSRVLDPRLARRLVQDGVRLEDIKSEQRTLSVLFSDIRGFTSLSEKRPPAEIVEMLNRYLSMQAETVFRHGGAVDKFIGDAIMAFWGAPTDDARHAEHAVACALEMSTNVERFNAEIADTGIAIDIGVGVHSGPAVVGFVGSRRKTEYTAIGDTVNLASRIEGETKGRSRILVTGATRELCANAYDWRPYGEVAVRNRGATVDIYTPEPKATGD
jgi:adenylate cyclase